MSVAVITSAIFSRNFTANMAQELRHTENGVATIIEDWEDTLRGMAESFASRLDVQEALKKKNLAALQEIVNDTSETADLEIMALTDENGIVLPGTGWHINDYANLSRNKSVYAALHNEKELFEFEPIGEASLAMIFAAPIRNDEKLAGTVVMAYNLSSGEFSEMIGECFGTECTLFYGDVRAETTLDIGVGTWLENAEITKAVLQDGTAYYGKNTIGGHHYNCIYMPLYGADNKIQGMIFVAKDLAGITALKRNVLLLVIPYTALIVIMFGFIIFYAMKKMGERDKKTSSLLIEETQSLAAAAKENAATSQDQSTAVKEIVATMEDNTELSDNIAVKIKDVSSIASQTNSYVAEGMQYLEENVHQLQDIAAANMQTIDGIKDLNDKIENIWDIVTLINSVADQAKIIAFNAELEASSAGEAGKNFHIVASEIRRLADGIIDGTKEIKESIAMIQQSSDRLILASESGTETIRKGTEKARELEEQFASIKTASEATADSASNITTIIQQQALASEQILITLRQIASGTQSFNDAAEKISSSSQNLRNIAEELNK
ncbi:MAG: cache domain-containing protein [Treponema sp.]|nr:cache domain-containing protein [Treponema sp.]